MPDPIQRLLIDAGLEGWAGSSEHVAGARRIVEALREPTEEMLRAGADSLRGGPSMGRSVMAEREARRHWTAMLAARVGEG